MTKKNCLNIDKKAELHREHELMTYQSNLPMAMLGLIADAQDEGIDCRLTKDDEGVITLAMLNSATYYYLATDSDKEWDYDALRNIIDEARVDREESEREALIKKQALAKLTEEEIKLLGIK